jgi:CheY-like chemotaxis protein
MHSLSLPVTVKKASKGPELPSTETRAGKTILVVEDNEDDIMLLRRMFRRSRILNPVQAVLTVEDAICYLKGQGIYSDRARHPFPTLLLVDLHLSDGSGFDVLRWIRTNKGSSPAGVVVLSGSDMNAFKEAYQLGAHSFLVKPLRFEDFHNMVTHVRGIKLTSSAEGYLLELGE